MEEIVLKYRKLDVESQKSLLDFLNFLVQKNPKPDASPTDEPSPNDKKNLLAAMDALAEEAERNGMTEDILNEILSER